MARIKGFLKKYENLGDRFFNEIIVGGEYKLALNEKASVIVDVGALAGEFGVYMYKKARTIYALEPFSEHFEELETNIRDFNLKKIKAFKLALSDYNGEGTLIIGGRGGHKLVAGGGSEKTEKVQIKTLASFMNDEGIKHVDILKIDIELGEREVFGSDDFAEVADRINFIIGEHANNKTIDDLRNNKFFLVNTPRGFIAKRGLTPAQGKRWLSRLSLI